MATLEVSPNFTFFVGRRLPYCGSEFRLHSLKVGKLLHFELFNSSAILLCTDTKANRDGWVSTAATQNVHVLDFSQSGFDVIMIMQSNRDI